jgi:hypothetical protein
MTRYSRRALVAFGLGVTLSITSAAASFAAQTAPGRPPATSTDREREETRDLNRQESSQGGPRDQRLRITRAQERAWNNFADVVRGEADVARDRLQERRDDARRGPPNVVERLERRQQQLMAQSARLDHLLRALRPLYAELNRDQKDTADRLFFRPGADGGGRFFNRRVLGPGRFNFNGLRRREDNRPY